MKSRMILCIMLFTCVSVFGDDDAINEWLEKQPIKVGEKVNYTEGFFFNGGGFTLMHFAAMDGRVDVLQWLKEKGENINAECDNDGATPMHMAALGSRFVELMRLMYEVRNTDDNMLIPINLAARDRNLEAMKWFINQGVDVNSKVASDESMILHVAAFSGNLEAMKWLKDQGIDLNIKNIYGKTPLDLANLCLLFCQGSQEKFQKMFRAKSAQNLQLKEVFQSGENLIRTIIQDAKECIKWLEENGAVSGEEE